MYKRPPKRVERLRLVTLYSVMTLAVIVIAALLVMMVANYHYNRSTGAFEQRSLVQFSSTPSSATVEVDDKTLSSTTTTKSSVGPGERRFAVWREGYETWILNTKIPAGSLVWLDYVRLVPKERPVEIVKRYEAMTSVVGSPNNRSIIAQLNPTSSAFRLVDISHDTPRGSVVQLPPSTYSPTKAETRTDKKVTPRLTLATWSQDNRHVLVWRTVGKDRQLIIFDTEEPNKSVNVSRQFSVPIESAAFFGHSGDVLYVKISDTLRKLDVSAGTLSRSLVSDISSFQVSGTAISYQSLPDRETGARSVGVYHDGDDTSAPLASILDEKTPASIATGDHYNTRYTAIAEGKKIMIYQGHSDRGIEGMRLVASRTVDEPVQSIEFNRSGSHILARSEGSFTTYDVDRKLFHVNTLDEGHSAQLFWIDTRHLGLVSDGVLTMRDVDGSNVFELNAATDALQSAILSRNGTYLYSYGKSDDGSISLQRIRLILR